MYKISLKKLSKKTKLWLVFLGLLVILAFIAYLNLLRNNFEPAIKNSPVTYSSDKPDEIKPDENYKWSGDPTDPKKITIPSIDVEGYVQNVGVDQNQEVAVPNNIHIAGWFIDSVKPGEKGLSIIDGHVDGITQPAIFNNLENAQKGTEIFIEFGDGSTKKFELIKKDIVDVKDAPNILFSQNPKVSSQLNLITCIGNYDKSTKRYDKRIILSSQLK